MSMFCFQCQELPVGQAGRFVAVWWKTEEVAKLQDLCSIR